MKITMDKLQQLYLCNLLGSQFSFAMGRNPVPPRVNKPVCKGVLGYYVKIQRQCPEKGHDLIIKGFFIV